MSHSYDPFCFCSDCLDFDLVLKQEIKHEKKEVEIIPEELRLDLVIPSQKKEKKFPFFD